MAVGSLHSLLRDLPETLEEVPDDEDDFGGTPGLPDDGYTITLEEELTREYEFHTPFKFTKGQFEEHQQTYNMACKIAEQCGQIDRVAELVDIRFNARRMAMEGQSIWLEHSPYTDEGAAICYGYIEGAMEVERATQSSRETWEREFTVIHTADGSMKAVRHD